MRSTAANVSSYIEGQPEDWQPTLKTLRALCCRDLKRYKGRLGIRDAVVQSRRKDGAFATGDSTGLTGRW
jgi:hypothetical protein